MGEQAVDLRSSMAILRRNVPALTIAAAVGLAVGGGLTLLHPPEYTSSSTVLLPPVASVNGQPGRDIATEIRIVESDVVLGVAAKSLGTTQRDLLKQVTITAPTSDVIKIDAEAPSAHLAQGIARAVAQAEVDYTEQEANSLSSAQQAALAGRRDKLRASLDTVNAEIGRTKARQATEAPQSTQGKADATAVSQLTAQQANLALQLDQLASQVTNNTDPTAVAKIIDASSPPKRPGLGQRLVVSGVLGMIVGVLLAAVALVLVGRRDRRLRFRDEIADAVGSAVVASVHTRVPASVAGWTSKMETYEPTTVDAWALRQALRELVFGDEAFGVGPDGRTDGEQRQSRSIMVLTLAGDPGALAVGPQLASYAASIGVRTRLAALQRHESAAALWGACSGVRAREEIRPRLVVTTRPDGHEDAELTIVLAVVDRRQPVLEDLPPTTVTVMAVSSGAATAEDLARIAVIVDDAGRRIAGIVVANPDDLDRTAGRLLQGERSHQVVLPTRLTGMQAARPGANVSEIRRPG